MKNQVNTQSNARQGNTRQGNTQVNKVQAMKQKAYTYRQKLGTLAPQIDTVMKGFFAKLSALPVDQQIAKLQTILDRINAAEEKIQAITDETKKELLENTLEYLKTLIQAKLDELQSTNTDSTEAEDLINSLLGE
jgi:small-conductance mechanosensitive channel